MTIKEFSDKYDIPYHIVYDATLGVKPLASVYHNREYVEDELFSNVTAVIRQRIERSMVRISNGCFPG